MPSAPIDPPVHPAPGEDPVGDLLAQCLERDAPERDAAVAAACHAHPQWATTLQERWQALLRMGLGGSMPADAAPLPERLGEFRLLERLGGGGMGVVYRALQEPLGREVALKLIQPAQLLFPRARERFRREAEAIARLSHPGIVPIHTFGETQDTPWFAMERFDGATLAAVLDTVVGRAPESLSGRDVAAALAAATHTSTEALAPTFAGTWVATIVQCIAQIAEALQHAHERGVLHRDVKPSNVALGPDGRARLFDFGLAAFDGDGHHVTAPGAALGTLLYMPPEQLRGDLAAIDARSDVYALGVTLYEALTLHMPYQEATATGTQQAILTARPDAIRARNRAVPRDLEIVCQKAIARDRKDRYADAASFARDLHHVLAHRPIEARPPGPVLRAWRAAQQRPAAAAALALTFVLVVGGPLVLFAQATAHARELQQALDDARAARHDAEAASTVAREQSHAAALAARDAGAVADFLVELFGAADPSIARGKDLRARQLLDDGAARLDRELADQPEVRRRLLLRIGASYAGIGEARRASELLQQALDETIRLHGDRSPETAEASYRLGWALRTLGSPAAHEPMARALALRRAENAAHSDEVVRCLVGVAAVATAAQRTDDALAAYDEALALLPRADGDERALRQLILANRAHTQLAARQFARAADDAQQALALQQALYGDDYPGALAARNTQALAYKNLGRLTDAEAAFAELLRLGERVHGADSTPVAIFAANRAGLLDDLGRRSEAIDAYERAVRHFQRAEPDHPQRLSSTNNLALLHLRSGNWARAEELTRDLLPLMERADGKPTTRLAACHVNLALCCEARGAFDLAIAAVEQALQIAAGQDDRLVAARRARMRGTFVRVLLRAGAVERAQRELAELTAFCTTNDARPAIVAEWQFARGLCALQTGDAPTARTAFAAAAARTEIEEYARWVPVAARARLAALDQDAAAAERTAQQLAAMLGASHVEAMAAAATAAGLATRGK